MAVNISAKFGKDSELFNGLDSIADELLTEPHKNRTAIITFRPKFAKEDLENGGITPTIKVLQIEPINDEVAEGKAKQLQIAAFKRRTGNTEAPRWDPPELPPTLFDEAPDPVENPATDDGWDDEDTSSDDANEEDDDQGDEAEADTAPDVAFSHTEEPPSTGKRRGRA